MILSRYVLRAVTKQVLGVTVVLFLIVIVLQFTRVLARAAAERFPTDLLWSIVAWGVAQNVAVILPIGLALGVVLGLGRLYEDHEIAAMNACGAGGARVTAPLVGLIALGAAVLAALCLFYNPRAAAETDARKDEALLRSAYLNPRSGEFRVFEGGRLVLHANHVDADGFMSEVFAYRDDGQNELVAVARSARIERSPDGLLRELVLQQGTLYRMTDRALRQRIVRFEEQRIGVQVPPPAVEPTRTDALPTMRLWSSRNPGEVAELHRRLSQPVLALVLGCLAIRLARLRPRQSRYSRSALLVLIYFVYSTALTAAETWLATGRTPTWLGLWWLHAAVALCASLSSSRPAGFRPRTRESIASPLLPT